MKKTKVRKVLVYLFLIAFCVTSMLPASWASACKTSAFDYKEALKDSILFYDAQKCGNDVAVNNVFDWRGACHTTDGQDIGIDLTGGFHDAGDHMKFGITQGYAASVLGWSLYEYQKDFEKSGNKAKILSTLKSFTDYFLKSHPEKDVFYYQVGDGNIDHTYWGAPETQSDPRPVLGIADSTRPASDICGMTSAALSIMYLNYKKIDKKYAEKCLLAAQELYDMGKNYKGIGNGQGYYNSYSYVDDLAWAATWLGIAKKDKSYIKEAESYLYDENGNARERFFKSQWTMCWDDMSIPVMLKLFEEKKNKTYGKAVETNLNYWMESVPTTPGGLKLLSAWGPLKYAVNESMIALLYYKQTGKNVYRDFAKSQIDYILGDNPGNMSYIIGFGENFPKHPHHRAANGYTSDEVFNNYEAKHQLTGALVGGPDSNDNFDDSTMNFICADVSIDFNAGLVGALAGISKYYKH